MKNSRADKCRRLVLPLLFAYVCGHLTVSTASASDSKDIIVDLTHVLGPALPDFHAGNAYEYKSLFSIAKDGYADGQVCTLERFSKPEEYRNDRDNGMHFPAFSGEAAAYLVNKKKVGLVRIKSGTQSC